MNLGEPLVVNHVTYSDFNEFDKSHFGENTDDNASDDEFKKTAHIGFWFNLGGDFSLYEAPRTVKAYLSVKNPMRFDSLKELASALSSYATADNFVTEAERNGYDGVIINDEEFGGKSYVAFEPNQIKSATENSGAFDAYSNDIRFREDEEEDNSEPSRRMGLANRISAAATEMSQNHQDNVNMRSQALAAIGRSLDVIGKAAQAQHRYDVATMGAVADLARTLIESHLIDNVNRTEMKSLLTIVRDSIGKITHDKQVPGRKVDDMVN